MHILAVGFDRQCPVVKLQCPLQIGADHLHFGLTRQLTGHLLQKLLGEVLQRVHCGFGANLLQCADETVAVCGRKGVTPVDLEVPIPFDFPFAEYFDRFEDFELYRLLRFALYLVEQWSDQFLLADIAQHVDHAQAHFGC